MRSILVPLRGTPGDAAALETAGAMAHRFDAHLDGLYVRFDPVGAAETASPLAYRPVLNDYLKSFEYHDAQQALHARSLFERMLLAHDICTGGEPGANVPSGQWHDEPGEFVRTVAGEGRYHDLIVCGPPTESLGRDELGSILVRAGRPLLIATDPVPKNIVHTVVIAWKNTREAAHAVSAAMPILEKARRVVVMIAAENDQEPLACVDCAERMTAQLRWHGMRVESRMIVLAGRDAPTAILDSAHEIHADMLVMGGYGHSRAREFIFGGFTERVLKGAPLPVFICH